MAFRNVSLILALAAAFSCSSVPERLPADKMNIFEANRAGFHTGLADAACLPGGRILVAGGIRLRDTRIVVLARNHISMFMLLPGGEVDSSFRFDRHFASVDVQDFCLFAADAVNGIVFVIKERVRDNKVLVFRERLYYLDLAGKIVSSHAVDLGNYWEHAQVPRWVPIIRAGRFAGYFKVGVFSPYLPGGREVDFKEKFGAVKITAKGRLDATFVPPRIPWSLQNQFAAGYVSRDGSLVLTWSESPKQGGTYYRIVRCGPGGSIVPSFEANVLRSCPGIRDLGIDRVQSDAHGRIYIGWPDKGISRVTRHLPDGSRDTTFGGIALPHARRPGEILCQEGGRIALLGVNRYNHEDRTVTLVRTDAFGREDKGFCCEKKVPGYGSRLLRSCEGGYLLAGRDISVLDGRGAEVRTMKFFSGEDFKDRDTVFEKIGDGILGCCLFILFPGGMKVMP